MDDYFSRTTRCGCVGVRDEKAGHAASLEHGIMLYWLSGMTS